MSTRELTRRDVLAACSLAVVGGAAALGRLAADRQPALIAVTFDLEMSRNFPTWDQTHWDYEKGNLNSQAKKYTTDAALRLKDAGGLLHCFAVGQTLEQEDISWLKDLARAGHPIGNHTYDHVNIRATKADNIQYRFQRCPWLIEGRKPAEVIRDNIRLTTTALQTRAGITPAGFRTPGGFAEGLTDRPDLQAMLRELGFRWVSSLYPSHPVTEAGKAPTRATYAAIVRAQAKAQPFTYGSGLIEVPMSPISDIGAFRNGRWKLDWFLEAIRQALAWVIDNGATYDFLAHPSCLGVVDPEFRAIDLIIKTVQAARQRAQFVSLEKLAERAK